MSERTYLPAMLSGNTTADVIRTPRGRNDLSPFPNPSSTSRFGTAGTGSQAGLASMPKFDLSREMSSTPNARGSKTGNNVPQGNINPITTSGVSRADPSANIFDEDHPPVASLDDFTGPAATSGIGNRTLPIPGNGMHTNYEDGRRTFSSMPYGQGNLFSSSQSGANFGNNVNALSTGTTTTFSNGQNGSNQYENKSFELPYPQTYVFYLYGFSVSNLDTVDKYLKSKGVEYFQGPFPKGLNWFKITTSDRQSALKILSCNGDYVDDTFFIGVKPADEATSAALRYTTPLPPTTKSSTVKRSSPFAPTDKQGWSLVSSLGSLLHPKTKSADSRATLQPSQASTQSHKSHPLLSTLSNLLFGW